MSVELVKYSMPGWTKTFATMTEAITELRTHICGICLNARESDSDPVVDVEYDGIVYECRDIGTLLGTSCGCEYGVEDLAA